jgi:hypothetical protein
LLRIRLSFIGARAALTPHFLFVYAKAVESEEVSRLKAVIKDLQGGGSGEVGG